MFSFHCFSCSFPMLINCNINSTIPHIAPTVANTPPKSSVLTITNFPNKYPPTVKNNIKNKYCDTSAYNLNTLFCPK